MPDVLPISQEVDRIQLRSAPSLSRSRAMEIVINATHHNLAPDAVGKRLVAIHLKTGLDAEAHDLLPRVCDTDRVWLRPGAFCNRQLHTLFDDPGGAKPERHTPTQVAHECGNQGDEKSRCQHMCLLVRHGLQSRAHGADGKRLELLEAPACVL